MIRVGLIDVPGLVVTGLVSAIIYRRYLFERGRYWDLGLAAIFIGVFWTNVILLTFVNAYSAVFGALSIELPTATGILYIAAYVLWYRTALETGFVLFGRQPDQGGILWAFRLSDRTRPIRSTFRNDSDDEAES